EGVYDAIVYQTTVPQSPPPDPLLVLNRFRALRKIIDASPVPVIVQSAASSDISPYARSVLDDIGLHIVNGIEHGMTALGRAVSWHERRDRALARGARPTILAPAGVNGRPTSEAEVRAVLEAGGVPVTPAPLARS